MSNLLTGVPAPSPQIELQQQQAATSGFLDRGGDSSLVPLAASLAFMRDLRENAEPALHEDGYAVYRAVVNVEALDRLIEQTADTVAKLGGWE